MRYYGSYACSGCKPVRMEIDRYGLQYEFIEVAHIVGFTGEIPQLWLDDGTILIGARQILDWLRNTYGRL